MRNLPSTADINMMFGNSVVLYASRLVFFTQMYDDHMALITDIESGDTIKATFDLSIFTAPKNRIGYVNMPNYCFYVERNPVRRYKVGLCGENTTIHMDEGASGGEQREALYAVKGTRIPSIVAAYNNIYPPFEVALDDVRSGVRIRAFDKQFAVNSSGEILYKGTFVGRIPENKTEIKDIVWKNAYKHLESLLTGDFKINR